VSGLDRREFVKKAGIGAAGAGALWVAPSVLGIDAAFAGASCLQQDTLNWNNFTAGNTPPATLQTFPAVGSYPAVTLSYTIATVGTPGAGTNNNTVQAGPQGNINSNYYRMSMTASAAGQGRTLTYTWTRNIYNLRFTIVDIDRITGTQNWQDVVWLSVTPTIISQGPRVSGAGTAANPWSGNGTTNVGPNSSDGNVSLSIAGPITTLTINYRSGNPFGTEQFVGIENLTWCR